MDSWRKAFRSTEPYILSLPSTYCRSLHLGSSDIRPVEMLASPWHFLDADRFSHNCITVQAYLITVLSTTRGDTGPCAQVMQRRGNQLLDTSLLQLCVQCRQWNKDIGVLFSIRGLKEAIQGLFSCECSIPEMHIGDNPSRLA